MLQLGMDLTVFFSNKNERIHRYSFTLSHTALTLVVSALGYDIVDIEDKPMDIAELLDSIRLYQTSEMGSIVDVGRPAILQYGGQVEGVTLPDGIPFQFPEVEAGFIGEWIETIRQFAERAKSEHSATHIFLPSEP
jgi:hypothetical protein